MHYSFVHGVNNKAATLNIVGINVEFGVVALFIMFISRML